MTKVIWGTMYKYLCNSVTWNCSVTNRTCVCQIHSAKDIYLGGATVVVVTTITAIYLPIIPATKPVSELNIDAC